MAFVNRTMNDSEISTLINEIAKTHMTGKTCSKEEFINTYLNIFENAKGIIKKREEEKLSPTLDDFGTESNHLTR